MPKGIYKRKPREPINLRWRIYPASKINRIIKRIDRIVNQLNRMNKELSNG